MVTKSVIAATAGGALPLSEAAAAAIVALGYRNPLQGSECVCVCIYIFLFFSKAGKEILMKSFGWDLKPKLRSRRV